MCPPSRRVPQDHPLRAIRALVDDVLRDMSREFDGLYATVGRPSIPPERLLRAQLLQIFYSIRSERLLMEQLDYNLLFRWFVEMELDEPIWDTTVFTKNRDRLLNQAIARSFFRTGGRPRPRADVGRAFHGRRHAHRGVGQSEEFSAEGRRRGGRAGRPRLSAGRRARTTRMPRPPTPDARLYRRSNNAEARLSYLGHLLIENRHGLIADAMATRADGYSEREAATRMVHDQWHRAPWRHRTLGADKGYDVADFVGLMRELGTTPHVTQNLTRPGRSAIDGRTTRHAGLCDEPTRAATHRTGVRLVEDHRLGSGK